MLTTKELEQIKVHPLSYLIPFLDEVNFEEDIEFIEGSGVCDAYDRGIEHKKGFVGFERQTFEEKERKIKSFMYKL